MVVWSVPSNSKCKTWNSFIYHNGSICNGTETEKQHEGDRAPDYFILCLSFCLVKYIYDVSNEILCGNENTQPVTTCSGVDESHSTEAEQMKSNNEEYMCYELYKTKASVSCYD